MEDRADRQYEEGRFPTSPFFIKRERYSSFLEIGKQKGKRPRWSAGGEEGIPSITFTKKWR